MNQTKEIREQIRHVSQIEASQIDKYELPPLFIRVIQLAAVIFDVKEHEIIQNVRGTFDTCAARQVVYLIMHRKYGFTMKQIGREMGRRHHSTVVHGMRVAEYSLGFKQDKYHLRTKDLWEMVS